jgi:hypothetical protein
VSAKRFAVSVLIAAGAFAATASIATARLETQSRSTTIAADTNGAATTRCPRGSEAVSGGFAAPGFDPEFNGRSILPFVSKRNTDRKWKTKGYNFADTQSGTLISYAYCDTREPGLSFRFKTKTLPAFDPGSVTARCPRGSEAVSGGFASPDAQPNGDVMFSFTSKRVGERRWKVSAYNNDPTNPQRLTAFAYCNEHEPGLRTESDDVSVPLGQKRSETAECRHGREAYSGGYKGSVDTDANGPFPFASKRKSGDWRAAAVGNGSSGGPFPFTVFAYCK